MARNERFSTDEEIRRILCMDTATEKRSGPILRVHRGKRYYLPNDSHVKVTGSTGMGKSTSVSIPFVRNIVDRGTESALIVDPKGEIYSETAGHADKHKVYVLDFRSPATSPDRLNLLELPYINLKSEYTSERDMGRSQVRSMLNVLLPEDNHGDPFWPQAGRRLLSGCLYGLVETCDDPSEVNLNSLAEMLLHAEEGNGPGFGLNPPMKQFYDSLEEGSIARRDLASYIFAARDTKLSIYSVASNAMAEISNSEGLLKLLSYEPTIHLNDLDLNEPFLLYIIMPDEDSVYTKIIGIIITMFTQKLIQRAQDEFDGALPVRTNILLEEIGSIGNSIPNLPNLMSASRSRNMRITVCCQSDQQLIDVYGPAKAAVIESCFGATVAFSTNDEDQLKRLSIRLGERTVTVTDEYHTYTRTEPLLTPNQIRAMPVGTALVFLGNNVKFVSNLHMYRELYPDVKPIKLSRRVKEEKVKLPCFSLSGYLKRLADERREREEAAFREIIEKTEKEAKDQLRIMGERMGEKLSEDDINKIEANFIKNSSDIPFGNSTDRMRRSMMRREASLLEFIRERRKKEEPHILDDDELDALAERFKIPSLHEFDPFEDDEDEDDDCFDEDDEDEDGED